MAETTELGSDNYAEKRQSKLTLTEEEGPEEARRMARSDSVSAGPEAAALLRLRELKQKARSSKANSRPRLTRIERVQLRVLRLL